MRLVKIVSGLAALILLAAIFGSGQDDLAHADDQVPTEQVSILIRAYVASLIADQKCPELKANYDNLVALMMKDQMQPTDVYGRYKGYAYGFAQTALAEYNGNPAEFCEAIFSLYDKRLPGIIQRR